MTGTDELAAARRAQAERRLALADFADAVRAGRGEALLPPELRAMLAALGEHGSLASEIGVLRVMLARLVALELVGGDPHQLALTLARLVNAIGRAMQLQRALAGEPNDVLQDLLVEVLADLGLGAEEMGL